MVVHNTVYCRSALATIAHKEQAGGAACSRNIHYLRHIFPFRGTFLLPYHYYCVAAPTHVYCRTCCIALFALSMRLHLLYLPRRCAVRDIGWFWTDRRQA